jgi:thiamine-phosphate pyrophosphorylase
MAANQPQWPREWLMTDERIGHRLWEALHALPAGTGVVFRHYSLGGPERMVLGRRVAELCRRSGLTLAVASDVELARFLGAAMIHNPAAPPGTLPFSRSVHSRDEAEAAWQSGAQLVFLSPVAATRSHPGRAPLPDAVIRQIVEASPIPVVALGGMSRSQFRDLKSVGFYGWAGIDAWLGT